MWKKTKTADYEPKLWLFDEGLLYTEEFDHFLWKLIVSNNTHLLWAIILVVLASLFKSFILILQDE